MPTTDPFIHQSLIFSDQNENFMSLGLLRWYCLSPMEFYLIYSV